MSDLSDIKGMIEKLKSYEVFMLKQVQKVRSYEISHQRMMRSIRCGLPIEAPGWEAGGWRIDEDELYFIVRFYGYENHHDFDIKASETWAKERIHNYREEYKKHVSRLRIDRAAAKIKKEKEDRLLFEALKEKFGQ